MAGVGDTDYGDTTAPDAVQTPSWATGDIYTPGNAEVGDGGGSWSMGSGPNYGATVYDPTGMGTGNMNDELQQLMRQKGFQGNFFSQVGPSGSIASASDNGGGQKFSPEFNNFMKANGITPSLYEAGGENGSSNLDFTQGGQVIGRQNTQGLSGKDFMTAMELGVGGFGAAAGMFGQAGSLGSYAGNAGTSFGRTLGEGGSLGDALKAAGTGAGAAGIGQLSSMYNPAGAVGVPTDYQSYVNSGLAKGTTSLLTGGNPTQALAGAALGAAGKFAGNNLGDSMDDGGGSTGLFNPYISNSGGAGFDVPSSGGFGQNMFDQSQASTPQFDTTNPLGMGGNSLPQPSKQQGNPIMDQIKSGIQSMTQAGSGSGLNFGNIGSNLLDMYNRNRQMQGNQRMADNLSSMYGQNSAYSQQLQQALMRAAGKNGTRQDFGGRAVELQARLADANTRNAPLLNTLQNQQGASRNAMLSDIYRVGAGGQNGGGVVSSLLNNYGPQQSMIQPGQGLPAAFGTDGTQFRPSDNYGD